MVPLRSAAAKTIHRSQGATETRIVVNFETKKTIPHINYVGLSRVTTLKGLYRTDLPHKKLQLALMSNLKCKDDIPRQPLTFASLPFIKSVHPCSNCVI